MPLRPVGRVTVDVREHALIAALSGGQPADIHTAALDVGDVHVRSSDGVRVALLELKTAADLAASIVDGRHASQRSRLLAARAADPEHTVVAYVLRVAVLGASTPDRVLSAAVSLAVRYGIPVLRVTNLDETVRVVHAVAAQLERPPPDNAALADTYATQGSLAHVQRKANLKVGNNAWVAMLSCVPGLSGRGAKAIADQGFGSAAALLRCDRVDATARIADVVSSADGAKRRRIGPAVATRVVASLHGDVLA